MKYMNNGHAFLQSCVDQYVIPGAQFAIVTKDDALFDYLGCSQIIPEPRAVTEDTIYDLASLTKAVCTTTLALQLIEQGLIYLQMPVCQILDDFPWQQVTVGQLLTHTSGMREDDKNYKDHRGKEDMYKFLISLPLDHNPGSAVEYSDFGFIVLGRIIEKIAGCSLDEYGEQKIFGPLGMKHTCFNPKLHGLAGFCAATEEEDGRGIICGEVHDGKAWRMGGVSGHAGLFSDVYDLISFVQMMLNDGEREGVRILSPASIRLLKQYRTTGMQENRTIGWFAQDLIHASCGDFTSSLSLYHTGFTGTSVYIDFEREMGIILLVNAVHPHRVSGKMIPVRNRFHNIILSEYDKELL